MNKYLKLTVVAALPLMAAACDDFLTGGELSNDPNRPVEATADQTFSAVQANTFLLQTGEMARAVSVWMQSMAGTERQYLGLGEYVHTESTFDGSWAQIYAAGGLIDIRRLQAAAREVSDNVYLGVAQVYEALQMGTAADLWGDIPYTQALQSETPTLDKQRAVYDSIQLLLNRAKTNLAGTGRGPRGVDLNYGGDAAKYTAMANTLKARYFTRLAEAAPPLGLGAQVWDSVAKYAAIGISSPANDFTTKHSGNPGEENLWYQFIVDQRSGYLSAGSGLVDTLKGRGMTTTLTRYYNPKWAPDTTQVHGNRPGDELRTSGTQQTDNLSSTRLSPTFSQPIVTWAETRLLLAEAEARRGREAEARAALASVNTALFPDAPSPAALSGQALLHEILVMKYIALFQQIEVYNDYRRTCTPNLDPATGKKIPSRFFYGTSERQTNPNVSPVGTGNNGARNQLDPANTADVKGLACKGGA